ncbi:MAG: ATP-dependent DNA ligase [Bacteroidota bacterium]|nr:ATP-dependent DNA ligase [Bacteroidota bacterium]MEC8032449.1 ATP-dependent DNA ligase [Bacteroidota bacterium]MEC8834820.1 ATP-dependent DNA ligase [Bacteroidota bacterium]MEC9221034.1 ATP-dependent DNA ligase [Bacteroidota bacterium]
MKDFSALVRRVDQTTKTSLRLEALVQYFSACSDSDKVWCIALFTKNTRKRPMSSQRLREIASDIVNLPPWLIDESKSIVGDTAETLALLLPDPIERSHKTLSEWMVWLEDLKTLKEEPARQEHAIKDAWKSLNAEERFVFNKLITGGFRLGIASRTVIKALAKDQECEEGQIALALSGQWDPMQLTFEELMARGQGSDLSIPYPFYLAYPIPTDPKANDKDQQQALKELGAITDYQIEWKWDGIRGQLIRRKGKVFLWSRGSELISDSFPELIRAGESFNEDVVLDGEIVAYTDSIEPFEQLQRRLGRKQPSKNMLQKVPVRFIAYDILERDGKDLRKETLKSRRSHLEQFMHQHPLDKVMISDAINVNSWSHLVDLHKLSRQHRAEGFMIKANESQYREGRKRGDWWKWKVNPMTVDAVLLYANRGSGRRANLYSDYTFAVWSSDDKNTRTLLPFAKAYSGLTDKEITEVDKFVKKNTKERFGPVRSVIPQLVMEIGFEDIRRSTRHKSGFAVRFPRILRWRKDKPLEDIDSMDRLQYLLDDKQGGG